MKRVGNFLLRILLIYLFLYIFPFPLGYLPFGIGSFISETKSSFWQWITSKLVNNIFGFNDELSFSGRGSGDTLYAYYLVAVRLLLAIPLALTLLFLKKSSRIKIQIIPLFIILIRYYVAFTLFTYGFSKVFYLQFPELSLFDLTRKLGDSAPMSLLWRFMAYSETYSLFTGLVELFGGFLLLFRNTKILGALISLSAMFHVLILNMSYDVPVKLFSFHLCVLSAVILFPDYKNLIRFFILNKPSSPEPRTTYFKGAVKNWIGYSLKAVLLIFVLYTTIAAKIDSTRKFGKGVPIHSIYGIYNIKHFAINGDTIPPLLTDNSRWKMLLIDKKNSMIKNMDDSGIVYEHEVDSVKQTIQLRPYLDKFQQLTLEYRSMDSIYQFTTIHNNDTIKATATRQGREDFFLINRGLHWINEYPMQR